MPDQSKQVTAAARARAAKENAQEDLPEAAPTPGPTDAQIKNESVPPGMVAIYVAIPDRVSNGEGVDAKPGERLIGTEATADALEERGYAFRDKEHARFANEQFVKKKVREAEEKAAARERLLQRKARWAVELEQEKERISFVD